MGSKQKVERHYSGWRIAGSIVLFIAIQGFVVGLVIGIVALASRGKIITVGNQDGDMILMSLCLAFLANCLVLLMLDVKAFWDRKFRINELLEIQKEKEQAQAELK